MYISSGMSYRGFGIEWECWNTLYSSVLSQLETMGSRLVLKMVCIPSGENLVSMKWMSLKQQLLRAYGFTMLSVLEYFTMAKKQNFWKVTYISPGRIVLKSFKDLTLLLWLLAQFLGMSRMSKTSAGRMTEQTLATERIVMARFLLPRVDPT